MLDAGYINNTRHLKKYWYRVNVNSIASKKWSDLGVLKNEKHKFLK